MALCLAESLIEKPAFDPRDQLERYLRWFEEGYLSSTGQCFDIGSTTADARRDFEQLAHHIAESTEAKTAGNGSLMPWYPVALRYADHPEEAILRAADSSRTTHGHPRPWMLAAILPVYLWRLLTLISSGSY